jgi:hypothetical protein
MLPPKKTVPKKDEVADYVQAKLDELRKRDPTYHFNVVNSLGERLGYVNFYGKIGMHVRDRAQAEGKNTVRFIDDLFRQHDPDGWLKMFYGGQA